MDAMQFDSPDDEILGYILANYSPEYAADLQAALSLLYSFGVEIQDTLCEMIYDPSADDKDTHRVGFSNAIQQGIVMLLCTHGVDVEETKLCESNAILSALQLVQNTDNPVPYLRVIELNTIDNEEKLVRILKDFCYLDEGKLHTFITGVTDTLISLLYTTLLQLEQRDLADVEPTTDPMIIINNFRQFESCFGKSTFGHAILFSGMRAGLPIRLYLAYLDSSQHATEREQVALDIYSLLLLGEDTYQGPIAAYRGLTEALIGDLKEAQAVEVELQKIQEKFEQFKKETK